MDYISAVKAVMSGKRVVSGTVTNGEPEELVIECDAAFIRIPRSPGANSQNYVFKAPSVYDITRDDWREYGNR